MKKVLAGLLCFGWLFCDELELVIDTKNYQAMPLLVVLDETVASEIQQVVSHYVSSLLGATQQFKVVQRTMKEPKKKQELRKLADEGFPLALFFSDDRHDMTWRLYDLMSGELIKGKKCKRKNLSDVQWSIIIAEEIWPLLTSQEGSFSSLIAASKQSLNKSKRPGRDLYLIHPFLSAEKFSPICIVKRGNNFAPRWHCHKSVIFYSQHTLVNVRLMSVDSNHISRIITSFEGQNMTPAISSKGRVVLALSSSQHTQLYEYIYDQEDHKGRFVRLTREMGDFISPSFLTEDKIVFCYIDVNNRPKLGVLDLKAKKIQWLSVGSALCPAVNPVAHQIAFCKKVNGIYQLFSYDLDSQEERQLTKGAGHKDECSWSPCGNYITCSVEQGDDSRIGLLDVNTLVMRYLTPRNEQWAYPSWSGRLKVPFSYVKSA